MKTCKLTFYNMGFADAKNSASVVIFQAWILGFLEGWIVAVNAISLLKSSAFRDPNQIHLPNDPTIQVPIEEQPDEKDEEGEDNPVW